MRAWLLRVVVLAPVVSFSGVLWGQTSPTIAGPAGTYTSTVTLAQPGPIALLNTFNGPAGTYSVTVPGPVVIQRGDGTITFVWKPSPAPDPTPTPTPPSPAPMPVPGVMIIYESDDLSKYPSSQTNVLYDSTLRQYLDSVTPVGPDGQTHEYRIWDKDVQAGGDTKHWQDALARPRKSVPWIIISNGKTGTEQPLPANVQDTITLIKKYEVVGSGLSSNYR